MQTRSILRLVKYFLSLKLNIPYQKTFFLHDFRKLESKAVDRDTFLIKLSKGKKVLHFGFLDSPLLESKFTKRSLLHLQLKTVTKKLYGIDIDEKLLNRYRKLTNDEDNEILDIQKPLSKNTTFSGYNLIMFPEILEHLSKPKEALDNIFNIAIRNKAAVCVTVPNALSATGFLFALRGIEAVHPDHYFYFSPWTLKKLLNDVGFSQVSLLLYETESTRKLPGIVKEGVIALCKP